MLPLSFPSPFFLLSHRFPTPPPLLPQCSHSCAMCDVPGLIERKARADESKSSSTYLCLGLPIDRPRIAESSHAAERASRRPWDDRHGGGRYLRENNFFIADIRSAIATIKMSYSENRVTLWRKFFCHGENTLESSHEWRELALYGDGWFFR
jgi:hypothetical protein